MTSEAILKQGAEAKLYIGEYKGRSCIIKERFIKKYRHPELDKQLTKERMRAETKAIGRCQTAGILVPQVFHMGLDDRRIYMEYFVNSITVKQYINHVLPQSSETQQSLRVLGERIGQVCGQMHANNIIHGDLTTSNMLLDPIKPNDFDTYKLIMIDFGLAHYHQSAEDKGVDLYVLERALLSTHSAEPGLFDIILAAYQLSNAKGYKEVVTKFEDVRARGRKRTMVG